MRLLTTKALLLASALMGGTIIAANAVTYLPPPAAAKAHGIVMVKSFGPPPECSEAAIRAACVKRPYQSCSESYKQIHNCP